MEHFIKLKYKRKTMKSERIEICQRCLSPLSGKKFYSGIGGFLRGFLSTVRCTKCGFRGLPITVTLEEYEKLKKEKKSL